MSEMMSIIAEAKVVTSVAQILFMVIALSLCLLFRRNRTGLVVAYLYTLYIGWNFCQAEILAKAPHLRPYAYIYLAMGIVVLALTVFGMLKQDRD